MALPTGVTFVTNIKGDKGHTGSLAFATAETVPWTDGPDVEMVGPESSRGAHFRIPLPMPGPELIQVRDDAVAARNQAETFSATTEALQDAAMTAILEDDNSDFAAGLRGAYTEKPALAVNSLTGWVHLDGAGLSPLKSALENANILQAAFDVAGEKGTVYLSAAMKTATIPVQCGIVEVTHNQVSLHGGVDRSEFSPVLKGEGSGWMITVKGYGFQAKSVNFRGDGVVTAGVFAPTVDGIVIDRSDGTADPSLANVDAKIIDCGFIYMKTPLKFTGRNVDIIDTMFSNTVHGIVVEQYRTEECRGFRVLRCRFHSVGVNGFTDLDGETSICIDIDPNAFNNQFNDNLADGGTGQFYRGPANRSQFNNNMLTYMTGTGFEFIGPAGTMLWQVVGNFFFGFPGNVTTQQQLDDLRDTPDHFVKVAGTIDEGLIASNRIRGTRFDAISIATANTISVHGNSITDPGMYHFLSDGRVSDGIYIGAGNRNTVYGNRIRSTSPGGSASIRHGINLGSSTINVVHGNNISESVNARINQTGANNEIDDDGYRKMLVRSAAGVPNNSLFLDASDNKLKWRDNTGTLVVLS